MFDHIDGLSLFIKHVNFSKDWNLSYQIVSANISNLIKFEVVDYFLISLEIVWKISLDICIYLRLRFNLTWDCRKLCLRCAGLLWWYLIHKTNLNSSLLLINWWIKKFFYYELFAYFSRENNRRLSGTWAGSWSPVLTLAHQKRITQSSNK